MFFTRTHKYNFSIPKEQLRYRLVGKQVTIHDLDFHVLQEEQSISVIPDMQAITDSKILPLTELALEEDGNKTNVIITSRLRKIDTGLPMVVAIFCMLLFCASVALFYISHEPFITISLCGLSCFILSLLLIRMQIGYFDYVRKIHSHIKLTSDQITKDVRLQLFKHKLK